MAKIVTVYTGSNVEFLPVEMGFIRWLKVSEALARLGHQVDMAVNEKLLRKRWWQRGVTVRLELNLSKVPISRVRWNDYDVVKTFYHAGFDTLERFGGEDHPFIISHLGSVVGPENMDGIYFYGKVRERLFATQKKIAEKSKCVTFVSEPARKLFEDYLGTRTHTLVVPGAADAQIPPSTQDPFPNSTLRRCIFAGNVYGRMQPQANRVLIDKLNRLGRLLEEREVRLYMLGPGDVSRLNKKYVNYLGVVPYESTWNYFHFADVGCVVAYGNWLHNNESTKIYYYLRAGLPVVSERGFPNDNIVGESRLGFTVENGNMELMAQKIAEATTAKWNREQAIQYILDKHTWNKRVEAHDCLIKKVLKDPAAS